MMKLLLVLWCAAALTACADMAKQNTAAAGFADSKQAAKNEKMPPDGHDTPPKRCFWVNGHCYGEPYEAPRTDEYHESGKLPPKPFRHGGHHFKPPHHHGDAGRRMPR